MNSKLVEMSTLFIDEKGRLCFMYDASTKCLAISIEEFYSDESGFVLSIKGRIDM